MNEEIEVKSKVCSSCKESKSVSLFDLKLKAKDGFNSSCKKMRVGI